MKLFDNYSSLYNSLDATHAVYQLLELSISTYHVYTVSTTCIPQWACTMGMNTTQCATMCTHVRQGEVGGVHVQVYMYIELLLVLHVLFEIGYEKKDHFHQRSLSFWNRRIQCNLTV
jgi:hypothetical protein